MSTEKEINYLEMSDEEIMNAPPPAASATVPGSQVEGGGDESDGEAAPVTAPVATTEAADDTGTPTETPTPDAQPADAGPKDAAEGGDATGEGSEAGGDQPKAEPAADEKKTPVEAEVLNQAALATELARAIAGGIKANGKVLHIRSADEGVKLMQMGAGYTRKMQELAPALRIVKMLSNNELLDERKITFLIDLNQKNPAAIQKLLADSEFDPLSVDKAKADSYIPGDHQVTDTEVQFQAALDDLIETPDGIELLREIQGQWDQESKQALLKDPTIVGALNHQRSEGIYQVIKSEVDRLTALGQIPVGTPFLQAYRGIGEMLKAQGKLGKAPDTTGPAPQAPAGAAQSQASANAANAPAPKRGPSEAAKAAAPVKATTTKPAAQTPNFLAMSDEEFLKTARV